MRFVTLLLVSPILLLAVPAAASLRAVTMYLDGARVECEAASSRGYLEISLPAGVQANSLRIVPRGGCDIARVEIVPVVADPKLEKEMSRLIERKEALADRLRALESREEIFLAAAKSQSGKAPRKSKGNPDPLASIRQGTDYAIAQLEGVYRAKRKAEKEMKSVDSALAAVKRKGNLDGSVARIWLDRRGGGVLASYVRTDVVWKPRYTFRLNGEGEATVALHVDLPQSMQDAMIKVVPAAMAERDGKVPLPADGDGPSRFISLRLPVEKAQYTPAPPSLVTFSLRNASERKLPAGEAVCFWRGEYLGKTRFEGSLPGDITDMVCGK